MHVKFEGWTETQGVWELRPTKETWRKKRVEISGEWKRLQIQNSRHSVICIKWQTTYQAEAVTVAWTCRMQTGVYREATEPMMERQYETQPAGDALWRVKLERFSSGKVVWRTFVLATMTFWLFRCQLVSYIPIHHCDGSHCCLHLFLHHQCSFVSFSLNVIQRLQSPPSYFSLSVVP